MPDKIISVRMPKTLVNELKELAEKNHYLDVSEEIRSLLRQKYMEHQDPYAIKLMAIKDTISKHAVPEKINALKKDLNKLLEEINALH